MSKTAEEYLNHLHWRYFPNGDTDKPKMHDPVCGFCDVEEDVIKAMNAYADQEKKLERNKAIDEAMDLIWNYAGIFTDEQCRAELHKSIESLKVSTT